MKCEKCNERAEYEGARCCSGEHQGNLCIIKTCIYPANGNDGVHTRLCNLHTEKYERFPGGFIGIVRHYGT